MQTFKAISKGQKNRVLELSVLKRVEKGSEDTVLSDK